MSRLPRPTSQFPSVDRRLVRVALSLVPYSTTLISCSRSILVSTTANGMICNKAQLSTHVDRASRDSVMGGSDGREPGQFDQREADSRSLVSGDADFIVAVRAERTGVYDPVTALCLERGARTRLLHTGRITTPFTLWDCSESYKRTSQVSAVLIASKSIRSRLGPAAFSLYSERNKNLLESTPAEPMLSNDCAAWNKKRRLQWSVPHVDFQAR